MQCVHETCTKLGTLVAYASKDPEFPGFHICLRRNNRELLLAIVESEESPFYKEGGLQITVYGDPMEDAPTHNAHIEPGKIIRCFREVFGEGE